MMCDIIFTEDTSVCDDIPSDEEEVKSKPVHQPSLPAETDSMNLYIYHINY